MKPKWMSHMLIATIQILELSRCITIVLLQFYYWMTEKEDEYLAENINVTAPLIMRPSYFEFFVEFFVSRHFMLKTLKHCTQEEACLMCTMHVSLYHNCK